jgi:hypothetical protein
MLKYKKYLLEKSGWIAVERFMLMYLLYFFLVQPVVSYYFPDWGNGGQVFQLAEEEDAGQSRFLEERLADEVVPFEQFLLCANLDLAISSESYYLQGVYKVITLETPNPPPEELV